MNHNSMWLFLDHGCYIKPDNCDPLVWLVTKCYKAGKAVPMKGNAALG